MNREEVIRKLAQCSALLEEVGQAVMADEMPAAAPTRAKSVHPVTRLEVERARRNLARRGFLK